jgi:hypothetical protein
LPVATGELRGFVTHNSGIKGESIDIWRSNQTDLWCDRGEFIHRRMRVYRYLPLRIDISGKTSLAINLRTRTAPENQGSIASNSQFSPAVLPFYPYTPNYQFPITDQEN